MFLNIGGYQFSGPYTDAGPILNHSGVYVILAADPTGYRVLDVGESGDVRNRLLTHDRELCWRLNARGSRICVAVFYCNELVRMYVERLLRLQYQPTCGVR